MKKIIKINLIILVIFCLSCNFVFLENYATTEQEENLAEESQFQSLFGTLEEFPEDLSDENSKVENFIEEDDGLEEFYNEQAEKEEQKEKDLDALQLEKSELENQIEESNSQIQFIEEQLSINVVEIAELDQKIYDKQMEIKTLEAQETELLKYIEVAEKELEKSNERYESQKKLLETRLVAMYEMGELSYLELLLNSKSFTEFVSNYFLIEEITNSDAELLTYVEDEINYNKNIKEALDSKRETLSSSRESREKKTISLENMALIRKSKIKKLTADELELQQSIQEYQEQVAEIETEIRLLAIASVGSDYIGGAMAWPVPGYTRITSTFGMRTHPITGVYKLHTGVDIGAPRGSHFIAANDGMVTYAGYNRAYGNMVIIDHGGGVTTLYAHGDEILVQVGDYVLQGDSVLKVGSTGYSTGPHAHFEVRINGEYVQPLDYITSYSKKVEENENNIILELEENEETSSENVIKEDENVIGEEQETNTVEMSNDI